MELRDRPLQTGHLEAAQNAPSPASTGSGSGSSEKRKWGRPRRSGADEAASNEFPLFPSLASTSTVTGNDMDHEISGGKQDTLLEELMAGISGEMVQYTSGVDYLAHVIFVNPGEDISMKIVSFCIQGPKTVFVIACNGLVSNATLRRPGSSNEVTSYEGLFEIIKLSGSFTTTERGGGQVSRAGGLTVEMANQSGSFVVGSLLGELTAASRVQLVLGSYSDETDSDGKVKRNLIIA